MKLAPIALLATILSMSLISCSSQSTDNTSGGTTGGTTTTPPPADTNVAIVPPPAPPPGAVSKYDDGPRAAATAVNATMAAEGKTLFTNKGCITCHTIGKRAIGPDLKGVASRRTAQWMEQQILHPEVMTKEDPIAHALLVEYKVPMTNQKLTPAQAKAVIEYLKQVN
ncbi:MAG: cytochrome c [Candidatus Eisenbacteria bacterium]